MSKPHVAIIGAGLTGLMAAQRLKDPVHVDIFERKFRPGGRCATSNNLGFPIDHGAQYLTLRSDRLAPYKRRWESQGLIKRWPGPVAALDDEGKHLTDPNIERFVGCPDMDSLALALSDNLDIQFDQPIHRARFDQKWKLNTAEQLWHQAYDKLVVATPVSAAAQLLGSANWPANLPAPGFASCWATQAELESSFSPGFVGAFINTGPISWVSCSHTRPNRATRDVIVLHASDEWSSLHSTADPDWVSTELIEAFRNHQPDLPRIRQSQSHYWPDARARSPLTDGAYEHETLPLVLCGDWCSGNRIEGALLSGMAAADLILAGL